MQINLKSYLNPEKRCQNKQQLKKNYNHINYKSVTLRTMRWETPHICVLGCYHYIE